MEVFPMTTFNIDLRSIQRKEYLWTIYQGADASKPHSQRIAEVENIVRTRSEMWNHKEFHPISLSSPDEWLNVLDDIEAVNNLYRHVITSLGSKSNEDFEAFSLFFKEIVIERRLSSLDLLRYVSKHPSLTTTSLPFSLPESYKIYKLPNWKQA